MTQTPRQTWYTQFWPWFLIVVPAISVVLSLTMLTLAINTEDSPVVDDYYKQGKAINLDLARQENAATLGISTQLTINDNQVALRFLHSEPESGEALELAFYHATLIEQDFVLLLTRDAVGNYRASHSLAITGKWHVVLQPLDKSWKIQHPLTLPRQQAIDFNP
jgi:uncharacterized protein